MCFLAPASILLEFRRMNESGGKTRKQPWPGERIAVIVVDHGSRRVDANRMLEEVARSLADATGCEIVEPAHMDLAGPSLQTAFARCVERGAQLVVVHPYFLFPGRHWEADIPDLVSRAAGRHPGIRYLITAPLGLHPLMIDVIADRVDQCLGHASGTGNACAVCEGTERCRIRQPLDRT
jgi:sirohydrochlorin ferrochelatase